MLDFDRDEEDDTRQILCERCRKFVPLSDIKYLPKGNDSKMALCRTCLKTFNPAAGAVKKQAPGFTSSSMATYFCERCNYKFKFNTSRDAEIRCPYCGKRDKITEAKTRSAETLVTEENDF